MDIPWSNDSNYIVRCIEESFAPSRGGNPMITLKFEVVAPEEMEVAGDKFNIVGVPIQYWNITQVMDGESVDVEKTQNAAKHTKKLYEAFGMDSSNINPENPVLGFKGKCVYALLENDPKEKRKSPTAEQLAKGQKQGDVMIHPGTKKPLVTNYPKISKIFCVAEVAGVTDKPY